MKNKNITFWHAELNRVIDLVKFADQKVAIVAAGYTAILWAIISQKDSILKTQHDYAFWLIVIILVWVFVLGVINLFDAVFPRLKKNGQQVSYFYFGHVDTLDINTFLVDMSKMTEKNIEKQILEQIHSNSLIANAKMECVGRSSIYLFASIFLCLIFIFIL